jgi:hypothetical protein
VANVLENLRDEFDRGLALSAPVLSVRSVRASCAPRNSITVVRVPTLAAREIAEGSG